MRCPQVEAIFSRSSFNANVEPIDYSLIWSRFTAKSNNIFPGITAKAEPTHIAANFAAGQTELRSAIARRSDEENRKL